MLQRVYSEDFDEIYKIMEDSFPIDERRTYSEQKSLFAKDIYRMYCVRDDNGKIKAFISTYDFDEFVFVEHFAVGNAYRNQGLGARILSELAQLVSKRICLEVELPTSELPKRRIGFYSRCGFYLNHYDYIQPPISKGRKSIPLLIMTTLSQLSPNEFEHIKDTLYRCVYGIK